MKTTYLPTIMLSLFLSLSCFSFAQENDFSFMGKYKVPDGQQFGLSTNDGFIHAYPSKDSEITIYYIVQKGNSFVEISKEELEEKVEIEINSSNERLDIRIRNKEKYRWSDWKDRYNVSCEVYVPATTSCYLKSSDGNIKIQDLAASQKCKTSDGNIYARNVQGDLHAVTSDGNVHVEMITGNIHLETSDGDVKADQVDGNAWLATSDGDINLYKVTGMIEATTSDGDIKFNECAGSFSGSTSDGSVRGNMTKLNGKLSVVTSDGNIEVSIPDNVGVDLKMKGEDLNIPKTEISGKISEHHIQGKINGGGIPVELITSDGDVTLYYR